MNIYSIGSLMAFVVCLCLGSFAYIKGKGEPTNRSFAVVTVLIGIWSLFPFVTSIAPNELKGLFWARVVYIAALFTPPTFLHFMFTVMEKERNRREKIILTISYITFTLFLTILFNPSFIRGVTYFAHFRAVIPGPFYSVFIIFFGIAYLYPTSKLLNLFRNSMGYKRNRLKYVLLAFFAATIGGIMHFLAAYIGKEPFPHDFLIIAYAGIMTYAIIKYRLMDINIVFGKLATYLVLLFIIGSVGLGLMVGADRVFSNLPGYNPLLSHFLIFLLVSIALIYSMPHIKTKTEKRIERALFKDKYKYREVLGEFNKRLTFISQEEELLNETVENIANVMGVSKVVIMLMDELSGNYVVRAQRGLNGRDNKQVFTSDDKTIKWLAENKKALVAEEIEKLLPPEEVGKIKGELSRVEVTLCLPLIIKDRLGGVLALGEKHSREMFSHPDIELLENLSVQLSLAIIYKRLEAQMVRANRLVSLGTLAAGMAHEIRNPLSSIQTFAQLLPEKYNDREFREEFSKVVASDTQRINRLIESVMALAGPRPPEAISCNVNELLDETLFLIEGKIKKNRIKVIRDYDKQLPLVKVDKEQIEQAFLNIFLNALEVLPQGDGKLTISTRSKFIPSIFTAHEEKYVQVEIRDTGPGIEERLLDRIFEPFFTTRPTGTGLGMAIVHRIIKQHKGFINAHSELGKGTTFLINLPLEVKDDREEMGPINERMGNY